MKTLEIHDNTSIIIGLPGGEGKDKINYIFSDKIYSKAEYLVVISDYMEYSLHFEGEKLDVPNLKKLDIVGKFAFTFFQNMNEDFLRAPVLEKLYLCDTELEYWPVFIKNNKSLKTLEFRHGDLLEIPGEIFEMENLQRLSLHYLDKIRILPDAIKKLKNLVHFDLWEAKIEYLSPELFLLPEIKLINLYYSHYTPTTEVLSALQEFKKTGGNEFSGWVGDKD